MNILVLTHRLPFAPNRGDRIRAYHIVKQLAARAKVHVVSLVHDREEEAQAATLRSIGVEVTTAYVPRARNLAVGALKLATDTPLTHLLLDSPAMRPALERALAGWRPDAVLAYCSGVAPFSLEPPLAGIPFVLDMVDVDSAKWNAFAAAARFPKSWVFRREARCLAAFEARAVRAAFASTVVNERERDTLLTVSPGATVHIAPNGVDVEALAAPHPPAAEERVIFTAVFDYAPNADGAVWFAREVWPRVRKARPAAQLTLAGSSPTAAVRRLADDPSIEVTGRVDDMRPYLWRSAIAVAPIFQSRGVQNKVLEAVAAGLPTVVTQTVGDGLPEQVMPACRIADTADAFAAAVIDLLSLTPTARRREAARASLSSLGWPARLAPLVALIERAAASGNPVARAV
jgi:sugar transferase (PEP-CTERM/EpsH1 system associated)